HSMKRIEATTMDRLSGWDLDLSCKLQGILALISALMAVLTATPAIAANGNWLGTSNNVWQVNSNWSGASYPGSAVGDVATFNSAGNGNISLDVGTGLNLRRVILDTNSAAYTLGTGGVGAQSFNLNRTDTGDSINMNAGLVNDQLINANLTYNNSA